MLTYKTEQCSRCNGKGIVRFLFLFKRYCPLCNGFGQIHVPQYTHERHTRPFSISALSLETSKILKKKPELLNCLSPYNRVDLLRKHSELRRPRLTGYVQSAAEKQRRLNEAMMHATHQRQQFEEFVKRSSDQLHDFAQWNLQQQQNWANQQFKKFVAQHGGGGGH